MGKVYRLLFSISWGLGGPSSGGCNIAMTTLLYARRGSGRDTLMRAVVLRLLPDEEAEARLRALCSLSSKLWNEVDYAWRRMFFKEKKVDLKYL
jgi:hypothetical protein